jgi:hypothetical protein
MNPEGVATGKLDEAFSIISFGRKANIELTPNTTLQSILLVQLS